MEQNAPVIAKRLWCTVRAILFMMRKGISKTKLMVDLNMMVKRGKIASAKAIGKLMFHHGDNQHKDKNISSFMAEAKEYEFSCSNTPNYIFPFNLAAAAKKKNYYLHLFGCAHAPPTHEDDAATITAVNALLELLNNNDVGGDRALEASPMLPDMGQTPLARQLRITDSPFPLREFDEDKGHVDKAAEDFINRFYKDLKQQNKTLAAI